MNHVHFRAAAGLSFRLPCINRLRKVLLAGALLTLLLNISAIQMGSALSLTVTSSATYSNVNGGGSQPSCYYTATTYGGVTGAYVSYGSPSGSCPGSMNLGTQSGFGFVPAPIGTISNGVAFKLGTFTHYNHPIIANKVFTSIDLRITLNIAGANPASTGYTYTQYLDETTNGGSCSSCAYSPCSSPCPDKVYWNNLGSSTTFTGSDGKVYTLEILGFADCSNPGTPISQFVTQESTNNVACIYAKITECVVTVTGNPLPLSVCPGGTGSFKVNATGPALTYQWYKVGSPDQQLTNTGKYSGVTTSTLTITGVTTTEAGSYYVKVTGSCGTSKTSTSAQLTMSSLTAITTQPSYQMVCADGTAIFNVVATGSGTLTYQWQQSIDSGTNWSPITGQTGTSSTLTGVTASMNGYRYRVVVTGTCGLVTSNAVILTVQAKPTISAGPAQTICAGSTVQLAGTASNFNQITWSGGAGTFSPNVNTLNAVYTPTAGEIAAGTVTLTMTATPKSPCAIFATSGVAITVSGPPTSNFTATPSSGCPPLTVTFTNTSNGNGRIITGLTWDFGDTTTYNGQTPPVHIYSNRGTYMAKLTVTSSCGTGTKTAYITVSQPFVVPGIYGPACVSGSDITLAGSPGGGTWFGDGVSGNIFHPSAAGPGNHVLTYQYTSGSSCSFSNTTTLTVVPLPQTTITVG